jgi:hypothetical protein
VLKLLGRVCNPFRSTRLDGLSLQLYTGNIRFTKKKMTLYCIKEQGTICFSLDSACVFLLEVNSQANNPSVKPISIWCEQGSNAIYYAQFFGQISLLLLADFSDFSPNFYQEKNQKYSI